MAGCQRKRSIVRLSRDISDKQLEWRNHEEVRPFVRENQLLGMVNQRKWLEEIATNPSIEMFGIELHRETEQHTSGVYAVGGTKIIEIGTCGLTSITYIHRTAEYSMLIDPFIRGRGYGTWAMIELLNYGFYHLDLQRIEGEIFETNETMLHVAKKLGFKEEGKRRSSYYKYGKRIDSIIMGLLQEEWNGYKLSQVEPLAA